jgi:hypothetical protein
MTPLPGLALCMSKGGEGFKLKGAEMAASPHYKLRRKLQSSGNSTTSSILRK